MVLGQCAAKLVTVESTNIIVNVPIQNQIMVGIHVKVQVLRLKPAMTSNALKVS